MTANRLEIVGLGCTRGDRLLFNDLTEHVNAGELLHVTGSNGSGKTTLLRALCGLTRPEEGEIRWRGTAITKLGDEYHSELAYLGHKDGVHGELTPPENLLTLACTTGQEDRQAVERALQRLGLNGHRSLSTKVLSQGQRRRVALARLLVEAKPLWILDEPFTALDAASCRLIADLLAEHLTRAGMAVISSHQAFDLPKSAVKRIELDAPNVRRSGDTLRRARRASAQNTT